jgi:hypothetical protein
MEEMLLEGDSDAKSQYAALRHLEKNDPIPFVQTESRKAAEQLSSGGNLGLRHEIHCLRELRSRFREAALKKLIFGGGE